MNSLPNNRYTVSVILTVYNRAQYLYRCLNSLLNQSFDDWELIAIDDGSTDNSHQILKEFESLFNKIKVIKQENKKLALSRNNGIKNSLGQYITFLDSDDEFSVDHLFKRINFMKDNPEVDLIHGGVKVIGNDYVPDKNNPQQFIHLSECTIGATFFGKRNVFETLNGFKNINYSEDSEFIERAQKIFKVQKVNFPTYIYHRDAPDSITNNYSNNFAEAVY